MYTHSNVEPSTKYMFFIVRPWNLFYQALKNTTTTNAIIMVPIIAVWMLLLLLAVASVSAAGDEAMVVHWVSSFDETASVPAEHCWHEFSSENGFNMGFDMKLPIGQHPSRPVTVKKLPGDNDCHSPPHNVRLKPLSRNTEQRIKKKEKSNKSANQSMNRRQKSGKVERTGIHVRHLCSVPLWKVRIECSSTVKRCRSICHRCWTKIKK